MKRIATPVIGGVITSAILNLLIYPVIYGRSRQQHSGYSLANKATKTHAELQFLNLVFRRKSGISEGFKQPRCFTY
jgi:hypothetical protein